MQLWERTRLWFWPLHRRDIHPLPDPHKGDAGPGVQAGCYKCKRLTEPRPPRNIWSGCSRMKEQGAVHKRYLPLLPGQDTKEAWYPEFSLSLIHISEPTRLS